MTPTVIHPLSQGRWLLRNWIHYNELNIIFLISIVCDMYEVSHTLYPAYLFCLLFFVDYTHYCQF